jgi:hypothetical protein
VNAESFTGNSMVIDKLAGDDGYLLVIGSAGNITWRCRNTATTVNLTGASNLSTATWYLLAFGHDSVNSEMFISINGATYKTGDASSIAGPGTDTTTLHFGTDSDGTTNEWDGMIDEPLLFGEKLPISMVRWWYNDGNGRAYSELPN